MPGQSFKGTKVILLKYQMWTGCGWQEDNTGLTPSLTQGSRPVRPSECLKHRAIVSPTSLLILTNMNPFISQQARFGCGVIS